MPILGIPIPVPITDIFLPLYVPVYPKAPLMALNWIGFSKKFSAINFALKGSPGKRIVSAISAVWFMCGVFFI